ncbi:hemerythrin domain-containing protein [Streptomyces luteireticuli]|uniref:hemerythrin domain-containing protein n=1 Tax=Streptomyces luteireticuli TaxID=173858 RepID=UPI003558A207
MPHEPDIIGELSAGHRAVYRLFDALRATAPGSPERKELADEVADAFARHAVAVREHLHPVVRDRVADGAARVERSVAAHHGVARVLGELEGREADDPAFTPLLVELIARVTDDFLDEEQRLFPRLQAACPARTLDALGDAVRRRRLPARPHSGPAARLPSPGAGLVGRVRGLLRGRGRAAGRRTGG